MYNFQCFSFVRPLIFIMVCIVFSPTLINAQKKKKKRQQQEVKVDSTKTEVKKKVKGDFKPYDEIITKGAVSDSGLFITHRVKEECYFEIPDSLLYRDMLLVSRRAAVSSGDFDPMVAGERPHEALMIRWEKSPGGKFILLRKVTSRNRLKYSGEDKGFKEALNLQTLDPVLVSFPIKTISLDSSSFVIDIKPLFLADVKEINPFQRSIFEIIGLALPKKYVFKKDQSYVEETRSFAQNIEIRSMMTYTYTKRGATSVYTILMHRSMILLPEQPMQPRIADDRVGYFTQAFYKYYENAPVEIGYHVKRWRLDVKPEDVERFKNGGLVEPEKKIVFYIDNATPEKWKPYIKQGVEDWQAAFESAGFSEAIIAKDAPENDPDFHPEDVRYSVIRYTASPVPNAKGPSVADPRSGEIIESDIIIYHNVLKTIRNWRFAQTAANDIKVQVAHIPDSIIGEGLRYVVSHEVGHSLGLRHNMGASAAFPTDSLRSPTFTHQYGTSPSIMDYARFNYVAQPEDKKVSVMPPKPGPYDHYAINWAYRPIPEASNEYEEQETLNAWIVARQDDPWYYFGQGDLQTGDPNALREDLGDDRIKSSEYGIANTKYIIEHLDQWLKDEGESYDQMEELYSAVLKQYDRYLGHIGALIGGVYQDRPRQGNDDVFMQHVDKDTQRKAVRLLLDQYRQLPSWLQNDALSNKLNIIQNLGTIRRIVTPSTFIENLYAYSLTSYLVNDGKLRTLIDFELTEPSIAYKPSDLLRDIRNDIFKETIRGRKLDHYRQKLQGVYVSWLLKKSHLGEVTNASKAAFEEESESFFQPEYLSCYHEYPVSGIDMNDIGNYTAIAEGDALYYQLLFSGSKEKSNKLNSIILSEVQTVKRLIEKNKYVNDPDTRAHYNYLLAKINRALTY